LGTHFKLQKNPAKSKFGRGRSVGGGGLFKDRLVRATFLRFWLRAYNPIDLDQLCAYFINAILNPRRQENTKTFGGLKASSLRKYLNLKVTPR
jgi:hypothetical protein